MPKNPTTVAPINVQITVAERDIIDAAKSRIRTAAALLLAANRGISDADEWATDTEFAFEDVLEAIRRDAMAIDDAFSAADARRIEAKKGGA